MSDINRRPRSFLSDFYGNYSILGNPLVVTPRSYQSQSVDENKILKKENEILRERIEFLERSREKLIAENDFLRAKLHQRD